MPKGASSSVLVRVHRTRGSKVFSIAYTDEYLIWHLKIAITSLCNRPPHKQVLLLGSKELDNMSLVVDVVKKANTEKPLFIVKTHGDDTKKAKARSRRDTKVVRGKKFREIVRPELCFASGRGTYKAVIGIPSSLQLTACSKDFTILGSKDGRMFDCNIELEGNPDAIFDVDITSKNQNIFATWIPTSQGIYKVNIIVYTSEGPKHIYRSPFTVCVIDHKNKGSNIKKLIHDKDWNVEAAEILRDWASKEHMHTHIVNDIGISSIFDLVVMEPALLIQPLMHEALSFLIRTDSTKNRIIQEGGIPALLSMLTLNEYSPNPMISRFASRSFATLAELVVKFENSVIATENGKLKEIISFCNAQLFLVIGNLLEDERDVETIRNCARALATFSKKSVFLHFMVETPTIYPSIVELFENADNDISIRRYALATIANFTEEKSFCMRFFTEMRIIAIATAVCFPYTEDIFLSSGVRALANLACIEAFGGIVRNQTSAIAAILRHTSSSDSITEWEVDICSKILCSELDSTFQSDYINSYQRNDSYTFESVRLLGNLLSNADDENSRKIIDLVIQERVFPSLVRLIKSLNLELQYIACKCIALLSSHGTCREEIIQIGGLSALCGALNTCSERATPHIVTSLSNMPLTVKGVLLNIIGKNGIEKLVSVLQISKDSALKKNTAILLATLAGSDDIRFAIDKAGSSFLRTLFGLIHSGAVDVQTLILPEELKYDRVVGQGICGIVWKAMWYSQAVAVKMFNEDSLAFSLEEFKSEVALMSVLRHENIVHCIGSCALPENLYIVSELFTRGCLTDLIEDPSFAIGNAMAVHLALGAARGMKYLHTLGIIHRDLKTGNLLVSDDLTVKVADFGLSRMTDNKMTRGVGTPIYTAPETLAGSDYSQKADVYSYAFVVWELVTRLVPFADLPPFEAVRKVCDENLRPEIPENCIFEGLIKRCWKKDPSARPTFDEIVHVLVRLQDVVGLPPNVSGKEMNEDSCDMEEMAYNCQAAAEITLRTLRHRARSGTEPGRKIRVTAKTSDSTKKKKRKTDRGGEGSSESLLPVHKKDSGSNESHPRVKGVPKRRGNSKRFTGDAASGLSSLFVRDESTPSSSPNTSSSKLLVGTQPATITATATAPVPITPATVPTPTTPPHSSVIPSIPEQKLGALCCLCGQDIKGRTVKMGEDQWHVDCFACFHCKVSLLNKAWCKHENKPYCKTHYQQLIAARCEQCKEILTGAYICANNQNFHKQCFTCSKCSTPLGTYEVINGNIVCPSCSTK